MIDLSIKNVSAIYPSVVPMVLLDHAVRRLGLRCAPIKTASKQVLPFVGNFLALSLGDPPESLAIVAAYIPLKYLE